MTNRTDPEESIDLQICDARLETDAEVAGEKDWREACAEVAELAACAPVDCGFDVGPRGDTGTELRSGIASAFPSLPGLIGTFRSVGWGFRIEWGKD